MGLMLLFFFRQSVELKRCGLHDMVSCAAPLQMLFWFSRCVRFAVRVIVQKRTLRSAEQTSTGRLLSSSHLKLLPLRQRNVCQGNQATPHNSISTHHFLSSSACAFRWWVKYTMRTIQPKERTKRRGKNKKQKETNKHKKQQANSVAGRGGVQRW